MEIIKCQIQESKAVRYEVSYTKYYTHLCICMKLLRKSYISQTISRKPTNVYQFKLFYFCSSRRETKLCNVETQTVNKNLCLNSLFEEKCEKGSAQYVQFQQQRVKKVHEFCEFSYLHTDGVCCRANAKFVVEPLQVPCREWCAKMIKDNGEHIFDDGEILMSESTIPPQIEKVNY